MRKVGLLGLALVAACVDSGGNTAAMVQVIAPAQNQTVVQGFGVDVRIDADDPDDQAVVRVKIDVDGNPSTTGDQTLLATLLEQDGAELDYIWQTGAVPPGDYYLVYQVLETGRQPVEMSGAKITILTKPTLSVGQGNRTIVAGTDVTIAFNASDPDGVASYAIYADRDCNLNTTGDQITIASGLTAQQNSVVWMTAGVAIADYCIFITMSDGMNPLTVRQAGTIELHSDLDLIFAPMPTPPLIPDTTIVTTDPTSPSFYQLLWFDDLDDVDPGEMDISVSFAAQQNGILWFGLELYSQVGQDILRDDMVYEFSLPNVWYNGATGRMSFFTDGTFSSGLAYFQENGAPTGDFVNINVQVIADTSVAPFDFAYLFMSVPSAAFAFPIFTGDLADFEVDTAIARFDILNNIIPGSLDFADETVVIRYRDDT